MTFQQDAARSRRAFEEFVKPVLRVEFKTDAILSTERQRNAFEKSLDCDFGVDAIIVTQDGTMIPVASRVQFGLNFKAFSIRRSRPTGTPTEYHKLFNALTTGVGICPAFHVQAFASGHEATIALVETVELMRYVYKHHDQWRISDSGETFYVAPFADVAAQVYRVGANGQVIEQIKEPSNFSAA